MTERNYTVPMVGVVTVNAKEGTVKVEVDLTDLSYDLQYDYEFPYPDDQTKWDQQVITDCLMASPDNFSMTHTMTTKVGK